MGNSNYQSTAQNILEAVGGKENVARVTHCMTRLRFDLKDKNAYQGDKASQIKDVLKVVEAGGQYQFVIGPNVSKVYDAVCRVGGFAAEATVNENLDAKKGTQEKKPLTPARIGNSILNYVAGSISPLLPVIIAAAMFKTIASVLGPDLLGVISAESHLYRIFNIMYDAGFYYLPVYLGYTAATKLKVNPMLGLLTGGLLVVPSLMEIATNEGGAFSVYGIPCTINSYAQTVVPILLSIWVLSYVERLVKKYMPEVLTAIFTPFATMAIMLPVILCVTAPAGTVVGNAIGNALVSFANFGGVFAMIVIAAVWELLIMTGMHGVVALTAISMLMTNGVETMFMPIMCVANYAVFGMTLGAFLRIRDRQEKSIVLGSLVAGAFGGVTEPALFGVALKYRRALVCMMIGAAVGGAYVGITKLSVYIVAASNILMVLGFAGGTTANMVNGAIASVASFAIALVLTYLFGFSKNDLAETEKF